MGGVVFFGRGREYSLHSSLTIRFVAVLLLTTPLGYHKNRRCATARRTSQNLTPPPIGPALNPIVPSPALKSLHFEPLTENNRQ